MQVEKDLADAQNKFENLNQIAEQTKSKAKNTVQLITQNESDAYAKTLEANNAEMLVKISDQKAKADKKIAAEAKAAEALKAKEVEAQAEADDG